MAWRPDRLIPLALGLGILSPVGIGLAGSYVQAADGEGLARVLAWPGLVPALRLSLTTGLASTVLASFLALLILGALAGTAEFARLRRLISPLLALPHAAAALGLAFLIAPSGWLARALSPWATGWTEPPDLMTLNDPWGLSLTLGLAAKETPFLLLMALAAWPQCDAPRRLALAASLGYGRVAGFGLAVLPALARHLRLPIHAVLAYSLTSIDMALVMGPSLPPPLAVQILRWAQAPSLQDQPKAAAAALILLAAVALTIGLVEALGLALDRLIRRLAARGHRAPALDGPARALARIAALGMTLGLAAGLAGLVLWSVAGLWPFPDLWPQSFSLRVWALSARDLTSTTATTVALGLASTLIGLVLALALLEHAPRGDRLLTLAIYLPLLIPQVTLIPGLSTALIRLGGGRGWPSVALGHLIFVLPYILLSLARPWRAQDPRHAAIAATLGASRARIFWRLRLPMLLPALLTAAAIGFAVSVGQYLPTLLLSGGRLTTLTTEALALASGGNRRLIGAYAVLQMALPALGFLIAMALPRLVFARRKAMLAP